MEKVEFAKSDDEPGLRHPQTWGETCRTKPIAEVRTPFELEVDEPTTRRWKTERIEQGVVRKIAKSDH
jgi:hypothetical protein